MIITPGSAILEFWRKKNKTKKQTKKNNKKKQKNLSAVFLTKWGVPLTPPQSGNWPPKEKDYSTVE